MKKSKQKIQALLAERCGRNIFDLMRPEDDFELLELLPDSQDDIRCVLGLTIDDKNADYGIRFAAASYMLKYFASPFDIETLLNRVLERVILSRSKDIGNIQQAISEILQKLPKNGVETAVSTVSVEDQLLEDIARLAYHNPAVLKRWSWKIRGKSITCHIGDKKLF